MKWQWRILLLFCRRIIVAQRLYCRGRHQHRPDACFTQTTQSDTWALSQPFWKPGICQKGKSWIGSSMFANNFISCFNVWSNLMQLSPLVKTKRSSSGKSFPPLGPDTKVFVVWVERFDDIGRNWKPNLQNNGDQLIHLLTIFQQNLKTFAILSVATVSFCRWMSLLFSIF